MESYVYIVAIVLGTIMWLSVTFVYIKHQTVPFGALVLSFFSFLLVGMSVYSSVSFSIDADGIKADLAKAVEQAQQAQADAQVARAAAEELTLENKTLSASTTALRESLQTIVVQSDLRDKGLYQGPLDGTLNSATRESLRVYQSRNNLPATSTITPETLQRMQVSPIAEPIIRQR
jgi:hypothetical protein